MKDTEIRANFERLETLIQHLATAVRVGFERTDFRFERVEARLDQMDGRLDQMERAAEHFRGLVAKHFEVLESHLTERLDRLERRDSWP